VSVVARAVPRQEGGRDSDDSPRVGAGAVSELRWPARTCLGASSWFSGQPLRVTVEERGAYDLHLELHNPLGPLGGVCLRLADTPLHRPVSEVVQPSSPRRVHSGRSATNAIAESFSLSFQLVDSRLVSHRKTVVFVRHAQSIWNEAQSKKNVYKMAKDTDHALSATGVQQAEALSRLLSNAAADPADAEQVGCILQPDVVYVSPLTRAVQSAVIGLGPTLVQPGGPAQMTFMSNAREKLNLGGFDTRSRKVGVNILHHVLGKLRAHYREKGDEIIDVFSKLHFNLQQVEEQWWTEGSAETKEQVQARMREFMTQLLYSPDHNIVVVGHSHFFRAVLAGYMSEEFREQDPEFAKKLASAKLANCGVLRLELDPARGVDGGPIVDAKFLLGSGFDL